MSTPAELLPDPLSQIVTQVCAKAWKRGGFIEIYLTKQHEYTIFQSFSEYFNGGCKLQPPL